MKLAKLQLVLPWVLLLTLFSFGQQTLTISPKASSIQEACNQPVRQFTKTGTYTGPVVWTAAKGTISATGLYKPPLVTLSDTDVITVASADGSIKSSATAYIGAPTSLIIISANPLPMASAGVPYKFQLIAAGGCPPYVFTAVPPGTGGLPAGIGMDTVGVLSGTPTASGPVTPPGALAWK